MILLHSYIFSKLIKEFFPDEHLHRELFISARASVSLRCVARTIFELKSLNDRAIRRLGLGLGLQVYAGSVKDLISQKYK